MFESIRDRLQQSDAAAGAVITTNSILTFFTPLAERGEPPEMGEFIKTTDLPIDDPQPNIEFSGKSFCCSGTFAYSPRKGCEALVSSLQGINSKTVTLKLNYLVLGAYVTPSWAHEAFGRKIEKAMYYRDERGMDMAIVSKAHWMAQAETRGG